MLVLAIARCIKQLMRNKLFTLLSTSMTATFIFLSWSSWYKISPSQVQIMRNVAHMDSKDVAMATGGGYETMMDELNKGQVSQDNPMLIDMIKTHFLEPPSTLPYELSRPEKRDFSSGQSYIIDSLMNHKKEGFFVECGAFDGEKESNSLFFERDLAWNGLLIEADPHHYKTLKGKHRKAFTSNTCLSTVSYPVLFPFSIDDKDNQEKGRIFNSTEQRKWIGIRRIQGTVVDIQCFPLYSLLLALNRTKVDYLSLDIEGDELPVLKTIPFDKVDITVMTVEYVNSRDKGESMTAFLKSKGFELVRKKFYDNVYKKVY